MRIISLYGLCLFGAVVLASACANAAPDVLVPAGAIWNYVSTNTVNGDAWRRPGFDDSAWLTGTAPLGYDSELIPATQIDFGPDEFNKQITAWFRHEFVVTNAADYPRLLIRFQRDDGIIIYINGIEVVRDNLPTGEITPLTLATNGIEEGRYYHTADFNGLLQDGTNCIAAEVHQWSPESSDLLFDLELSDKLSRGPYLQAATVDGVTLRWRTPEPSQSLVRIGHLPGEWLSTVSSSPYTNDHEVTVSIAGLPSSERWYYGIGTTNELLAWGEDCFFQAAPTNRRPVRIWALGDSGTASVGYPWPAMVREAYHRFSRGRPADVWLMLGDNAYYEGTDAEYQAAVFDLFARELRQSILWTTIGNHETYSADSTGLDFPYLHIFTPPVRGQAGGMPSGTKRYYSFDHANIHFVCLDAMSLDRTTNGPMCVWLRSDLEINDKEWLIAFWHHPPYTKGSHDSDHEQELIEMRQHAVSILEEFGVDLVLCGHSHSYERSFLMHGHYGLSSTLTPSMLRDSGSGRVADTGPYRKAVTEAGQSPGAVYVVAGSSGYNSGGPLNHPAMFKSLDRLGSMVVDVNGPLLEGRFLSESGEILDEFTISKDGTREPLRFVRLRSENGRLTARWKSEPGRRYRIEAAATLGEPNVQWMPAGEEIVATEATSTWSITMDSRAGFFRIVEVP